MVGAMILSAFLAVLKLYVLNSCPSQVQFGYHADKILVVICRVFHMLV
jgi:hypothetical protein